MSSSRDPRIDPQPDLVLFDLDETLCDYARARELRLTRAFASALAASGIDAASETDLAALVRDSVAIHPHGTDHFAELLARHGVADAAAEEAGAWYRANRFLGLELFEDAVCVLEAVRRAKPGRALGIVTNGPTDVQRAKIELLALAPYVDFVVISEEFGAAKPDPAIFQEALRRGGREPHESVFIGDSVEADIAGAQASGIRSVWMNRAGAPWSAPLPEPDWEVADLTSVAQLLGADRFDTF
jgi:putative hydrolase of the HAD superfamily